MIIDQKVFKPNLTTNLIIEATKEYLSSNIKENQSLSYLEMGCGGGEITYSLKDMLISYDLTMTDISSLAIKKTKERFKDENLNINIYQSNLFNEIPKNKKFDIIISDVAAISEDVLSITDWYDGVSCKTGPDGINLIEKIIKESANYMNDGAALIYPALNLSNLEKLKKTVNKNFSKTITLKSKNWPYNFSDEQKKILKFLKQNNHVNYKELSGVVVFNTEVWMSVF